MSSWFVKSTQNAEQPLELYEVNDKIWRILMFPFHKPIAAQIMVFLHVFFFHQPWKANWVLEAMKQESIQKLCGMISHPKPFLKKQETCFFLIIFSI